MSLPEPGPAEPGDDTRGPYRDVTEQGTDPGRSQPYESLYRTSSTPPAGAHRTTARHFEPWLDVSEEASDPEDTFSWLYRREEPPAGEQPPTPAPPLEDDPRHPGSPDQPTSVRSAATGSGVAGSESVGPAGVAAGSARAGAERSGRSGRRGRGVVVAVVTLLVLLVLAAATIALRLGRAPSLPASAAPPHHSPVAAGRVPYAGPPRPRASASAAPGPQRSPRAPYAGAVAPLSPTLVTASCHARASTDDAGRPVGYGAERVDDGDPSTAWRCNGAGVGQKLVFTFPAGSRIASVGLVNGYAKIDPTSGAHRYGEYRRVREVTWSFSGGRSFRQRLQDRVEDLQTLRVPVQTTDRVTLTLTRTSAPGERMRSRDAVLISEAAFAGPRS